MCMYFNLNSQILALCSDISCCQTFIITTASLCIWTVIIIGSVANSFSSPSTLHRYIYIPTFLFYTYAFVREHLGNWYELITQNLSTQNLCWRATDRLLVPGQCGKSLNWNVEVSSCVWYHTYIHWPWQRFQAQSTIKSFTVVSCTTLNDQAEQGMCIMHLLTPVLCTARSTAPKCCLACKLLPPSYNTQYHRHKSGSVKRI